MYKIAPISSRGQFPELMRNMGIDSGIAAEIGTHRGEFAEQLLRQWPRTMKLVCVDPWFNSAQYASQAPYLTGGGADRIADFRAASNITRRYRARCRLDRRTSNEAVSDFADESLQFVYIDGDHSYEAVLSDALAWYPKIKPGCILAGHDWIYPGAQDTPEDWGRFIQPAVEAFIGDSGLDVYLVVEETNSPWSWYVIKPKEQQ